MSGSVKDKGKAAGREDIGGEGQLVKDHIGRVSSQRDVRPLARRRIQNKGKREVLNIMWARSGEGDTAVW